MGEKEKVTKPRSSWKCPKCGREFASKSAYHGCGNYSIEGYLSGKNPAGLALFNLLAAEAKKFPEVTLRAAKTQITLRVRANFMMVSVSGRGLQGYLALPRPVPKRYFKKIVAHSSRRHGHLFRIDDVSDLKDFLALLPEAVAMASDDEPKSEQKVKNKSAWKLSIGQEINSLYRTGRSA